MAHTLEPEAIADLPIHLLNGVGELTHETLERSLQKPDERFFLLEDFNEKAYKKGLFIDLSQVRWVNLGAAVQLTIFVEYAVRKNINVFVALPLKRNTRAELTSVNMDPALRESLREKREKANGFLKVLQFDIAVRCAHVKGAKAKVAITEEYEFGVFRKESFNSAFNALYKNKRATVDYNAYSYRYIFPLTWIKVDESDVFNDELERTFKSVLSEKDRGLDPIDVKTIKNVIISELVKNVKEHANEVADPDDNKPWANLADHALFAMGLMPTSTLRKTIKDAAIASQDLQGEFAGWLAGNDQVDSFIELYFADSGRGVVSDSLINAYAMYKGVAPDKIYPSDRTDILKWAFEKWSSCKTEEKPRGTKGLYRINRIVNKYSGLFLIRTHELSAGYRKGGFTTPQWLSNEDRRIKYFRLPGTFVQLKLCPYKAVSQITYNFQKSSSTIRWVIRRVVLKADDLLPMRATQKIPGLKIPDRVNTLLILQFEKKIAETEQNLLVEEALKNLSRHYCHPDGIVVYIDESENSIGAGYLEVLVKSIDDTVGKRDESILQELNQRDDDEVYDPILILTRNNGVCWYGGDIRIIRILDDLYTSHSQKLTDSPSFNALNDREKRQVHMHFLNENSLVTLQEGNRIEFNFTNIHDLFSEKIKDLQTKASDNGFTICTPKLELKTHWHKISELLPDHDVAGYALALYLKFIEKNDKYSFSDRTHILIDHRQQESLAKEFAALAGINEQRNIVCVSESIDHSIPRRTILFNPGDEVIILTTFVSSSETVRRLIKYVKRDMATALCVICISNSRKNSISVLQTWGENTDIYSLYQKYTTDQEATSSKYDLSAYVEKLRDIQEAALRQDFKFINADYEPQSPYSPKTIKEEITLKPDLRRHILDTKSLYFNHIGTFNGRHFTFYIDKKKILKSETFASRAFASRIKKWLAGREIKEFVLVVPEFSKEPKDTMKACVDRLKVALPMILDVITWDVSSPKNIQYNVKGRHVENFVYIDFGSLTGVSINTILSYFRNARNISVIVLFTQLNKVTTKFYTGIRQYDMPFFQPSEKLFDAEDHDYISPQESVPANINIDFIHSLPLSFYNSTNCPICEHERAIDIYRKNDVYMTRFSDDRKRRIKIRNKDSKFSIPTDFYADHWPADGANEKAYELSSELIMKMYELRRLLSASLTDTHYRLKVYEYIVKCCINMDEDIVDPESDSYALIYLLSNEVMWLQREPLVYRDIREMISEIALRLATASIEELEKRYAQRGVTGLLLPKIIRFKYAAITVLRSSHKYKFCQHIDNMLLSAAYDRKKEGREEVVRVLSDNLVQNIYYHINSLHYNQYNKSTAYFDLIGEKLYDKIISKHLHLFSSLQKSSLFSILTDNSYLLETLRLEPGLHASKIIRWLKEEFTRQYQITNHTKIAAALQALDFRSLGGAGAIKNLNELRKDSGFYPFFKVKADQLIYRWSEVSKLLTTLKACFDRLPIEFFHAELLETQRIYGDVISIVGYKEKRGLMDNFSSMVSQIYDDALEVLRLYDRYHETYDKIVRNIFRYTEPPDGHIQMSRFAYFLENYPARLSSCIDEVFGLKRFNKMNKNIAPDCEQVFYPAVTLRRFFDHVLENLTKRLLVEGDFSSVDIDFYAVRSASGEESVDEVIELTISYSGTAVDQDILAQTHRGGLSLFNEDLSIHSGSVNWGCREDGNFVVEIKFLPI